MSTSTIERLLSDAEDDLISDASPAFAETRLDDPDVSAAAAGWIAANPRANAILLLLALRRDAPDAYASVPTQARAQVLAAAMRERAELNDFGYLDETGGYDREAGKALIELGPDAIPALVPELDDHNAGQLEGSEEATLVDVYGLRRADFAYRFIRRLRGEPADFDPDPAVRDERIAALKRELA
jgi:hypothetical protein